MHGSGDQSAGRIDCCRRGCLVLEAERVKTRRNTPGFDDVPMTVVWRHWRELRKTPPYTLATKPKSQAVTRSEEAFTTDFEALLAAMETQIGR